MKVIPVTLRLLFYLEELCTDNFVMPSSSNGLRKMLNMQWDATNASVITWTYQRLYMSIAYCDEILRECTEVNLKKRGVWEEMKDDYKFFIAEAVLSVLTVMLNFVTSLVVFSNCLNENTGVRDLPKQMTRKQTFEYAQSELIAIENELKAPGENVYGRVDRVACWFLLSRYT